VSGEFTAPYYLRFVGKGQAGILAAVATVFTRYGNQYRRCSAEAGLSALRPSVHHYVGDVHQRDARRALQEINRLDFHVEPVLCMPILLD